MHLADATLALLQALTFGRSRCTLCGYPFGAEDRCSVPHCKVAQAWDAWGMDFTETASSDDAMPDR